MSSILQKKFMFGICCLGFTSSFAMLQALKVMISQDPVKRAVSIVRQPTTHDDSACFQQQLDRLNSFESPTFVNVFQARCALKNKIEPVIREVALQIMDEQQSGQVYKTEMVCRGAAYSLLGAVLLWGSYHGITDPAICDHFSFFMPASFGVFGLGVARAGCKECKNGLLYTDYLLQRAARNKQLVQAVKQKYLDLDALEKELEDCLKRIGKK